MPRAATKNPLSNTIMTKLFLKSKNLPKNIVGYITLYVRRHKKSKKTDSEITFYV